MSKLHFYKKVGGHMSKFADGEGTLNSTDEFPVHITWGEVAQGTVYQIRKGTATYGDNYNCLAGGSKNETARFKKTNNNALVLANQEHFQATLALQAAASASGKSVIIQINTADLTTLKNANYKLCFAKKVAEGDYDVVWQSYTSYLANNTFSWTPQYQLFGSNSFKTSVAVSVSTNKVNIGLGETSILSKAGVLSAASTGGPSTAITLENQYGSIHPGVNQISTGIDGSQISTPIYVAQDAMVQGQATLTPVEKVLVWFEQDIETSTMFSTARSNAVEIDLTDADSATRLYSNQIWSTP